MKEKILPSTHQILKAKVESIKNNLTGNTNYMKNLGTDGDYTDNPVLHGLQSDREHLTNELLTLQKILDNCEIIDRPQNSLGTTVTVALKYSESDSEERQFILGSQTDAMYNHHALSVDSPLGSVIQGKKPGTKVSYQSVSGEIKVEIIQIK